MRYRLGPITTYTPAPVQADAPSPTGKPDPPVSTIKGIVNEQLTVTIPAQDANATNTIAEVRAYLVPDGHQVPATAAAYVASPYPYVTADATALTAGGELTLALPGTDPVAHTLQVIEGFAQ